MICGARSERTYEGQEDDHYLCAAGHTFGIDWSHGGPPTGPRWPPSQEDLEIIRLLQGMRDKPAR